MIREYIDNYLLMVNFTLLCCDSLNEIKIILIYAIFFDLANLANKVGFSNAFALGIATAVPILMSCTGLIFHEECLNTHCIMFEVFDKLGFGLECSTFIQSLLVWHLALSFGMNVLKYFLICSFIDFYDLSLLLIYYYFPEAYSSRQLVAPDDYLFVNQSLYYWVWSVVYMQLIGLMAY